jgi:hypothetical protein
VVEEVVQHARLQVDGRMYLCLHSLKLIHHALDPSDSPHRVFCLVHPVTDVPLEGVVLVGKLNKGRGFSSLACLRGTLRIV